MLNVTQNDRDISRILVWGLKDNVSRKLDSIEKLVRHILATLTQGLNCPKQVCHRS